MVDIRLADPLTTSFELEVRDEYLLIEGEVASRNFPAGVLAVRFDGNYLELFPVASAANGGLIIKVRDSSGRCSILIGEVVRAAGADLSGVHQAFWSARSGSYLVDSRGASADRPVDVST